MFIIATFEVFVSKIQHLDPLRIHFYWLFFWVLVTLSFFLACLIIIFYWKLDILDKYYTEILDSDFSPLRIFFFKWVDFCFCKLPVLQNLSPPKCMAANVSVQFFIFLAWLSRSHHCLHSLVVTNNFGSGGTQTPPAINLSSLLMDQRVGWRVHSEFSHPQTCPALTFLKAFSGLPCVCPEFPS